MKDGEYWKQRFKQMEEAQHDTSLKKAQEIQEQFDRSLAAIDGKINAWYQRLANNNGVSMQEARKMLDKVELKEFQWNVEDYIKYAEENEISGAWEKQLENASARVHISRLEALKIETQQEMEKLYGNCIDSIDKHIQSVYTNDFYHTAFEIQKGVGVGTNIQKLNADYTKKIISKPWSVDEKNFSDRLWESKTKLINNVHNSLSRMCITGEPPDRAIKEIAKEMNVSKAQASRVVMTESAAFANKARQDCMTDLGVKEFEVVETLDSHTCETCGDMDGKHYPMKDYQTGVTAPPFHPNCRGCTCPYFDDEFTIGEERAARGADGKTYYVPADTTYNEWKNAFVYGNKSGFERTKGEKIQTSSGAVKSNLSNVHTVGKIDRNIYKCVTGDIITDEVIITDNQIQHIKDRHPNDYERFSGYFNQIVENPDYIIEANKPDTALILKEIECGGEVFKTVLRLVTSKDDPTYKNSIITFMKIDNKEWNRLLRNKTILYKRE